MNKPIQWIGLIIGFGVWFVPRIFFDVSFEAMLSAFLAAVIAAAIGTPIGLLVGYFFARDTDVDSTPHVIFAGMSLIAWIIPIAGFCLSVVAWSFSRRSETRSTFYFVLSNVGGLLAMINAGLGGATAYSARHDAEVAAEAGVTGAATVHSKERCAYAAVEAWPAADFERYCR